MKKSFLKTVAMVIASVLCVGIFPFSFGCAKTDKPDSTDESESDFPSIYLKVTDNKGNTFYMGKDGDSHEKFLIYDYSTTNLHFKTEQFYQNGEKYLRSRLFSFDQITVDCTKPGNQTLWQVYPLKDGYAIWFKLTIHVNENNSEN